MAPLHAYLRQQRTALDESLLRFARERFADAAFFPVAEREGACRYSSGTGGTTALNFWLYKCGCTMY